MHALPANPDELTPAWLSEVLGAEVTGVDVVDRAAATNQRARVALTYAEPGAGPATAFVKLAPEDPAHREMIGASWMGEREARVYADLASSLELRLPRSYFAASADDGSFVLLLEDLAAAGCGFPDGSVGVGADAAARALEDLAAMHARFADASLRADAAPWLAVERPSPSAIVAQLMRMVLDEHHDELTAAYVAVGERYVEHHDRFDVLWHEGPQTFVHGDAHVGNVFLDGGSEGGVRVGFLDWGLSRASTPLRDVSYFLTMTVDPEVRRAQEPELLRTYLHALRAGGGPDLAYDEAMAVHRFQASYTVVATFLAFMPSYLTPDAVELGATLRRRAELALDDLDVVDAVDRALA